MPRPESRPVPDPRPRPTRLRAFWRCAGFSDERLVCSAIFDPHQMTDLAQHACQDRGLVVLHRLPDPAQAERTQRTAVLLGLADRAACLCDADLGHALLARSA